MDGDPEDPQMATMAMTTDTWRPVPAEGWLRLPERARPAGARLLDIDPDLARHVPGEVRVPLTAALRVAVETLECGPWTPAPPAGGALGLLVIDGLLLRDLVVHDRRCAELLGPGDLLRPWPDPDGGGGAPVPAELQWQVVDGPARVAVLDRRTSLIVGRFPDLVGALLDRTLARARSLQLQLALTQMHGIGRRLEVLLWHLADRWGRVTPDGVVLPLGLTHEMLGRLIGARRPSVTTALCRLQEAGVVERRRDGWLLHGDPQLDLDPIGGA